MSQDVEMWARNLYGAAETLHYKVNMSVPQALELINSPIAGISAYGSAELALRGIIEKLGEVEHAHKQLLKALDQATRAGTVVAVVQPPRPLPDP